MIRSVCLAVLVGLAGCGLIDSQVAELDLDLPREVILDTADWKLTDEGQIPSVACAESPNICSNRVDMWCGADDICGAACGGQTCEVNILVALWHTIDLAEDTPELQEIEGQRLVGVTVDRVSFTVSENTLNVTSPPLTVSVAPQGVISTGGRDADEVGTIPAIKRGMTVTDADLELTTNGQVNLAKWMRDYQTPFNLIVGATVQLRAGDDVPSGRLVMSVKVSAHASTGL